MRTCTVYREDPAQTGTEASWNRLDAVAERRGFFIRGAQSISSDTRHFDAISRQKRFGPRCGSSALLPPDLPVSNAEKPGHLTVSLLFRTPWYAHSALEGPPRFFAEEACPFSMDGAALRVARPETNIRLITFTPLSINLPLKCTID